MVSRKKEILLFTALKQGRIDITQANRFYSGNNGKDALLSLEYEGYLKHTGFGNFVINENRLDSLPEGVVDRFRDWKHSQDESEDKQKKGGSDYEKVPVQ